MLNVSGWMDFKYSCLTGRESERDTLKILSLSISFGDIFLLSKNPLLLSIFVFSSPSSTCLFLLFYCMALLRSSLFLVDMTDHQSAIHLSSISLVVVFWFLFFASILLATYLFVLSVHMFVVDCMYVCVGVARRILWLLYSIVLYSPLEVVRLYDFVVIASKYNKLRKWMLFLCLESLRWLWWMDGWSTRLAPSSIALVGVLTGTTHLSLCHHIE